MLGWLFLGVLFNQIRFSSDETSLLLLSRLPFTFSIIALCLFLTWAQFSFLFFSHFAPELLMLLLRRRLSGATDEYICMKLIYLVAFSISEFSIDFFFLLLFSNILEHSDKVDGEWPQTAQHHNVFLLCIVYCSILSSLVFFFSWKCHVFIISQSYRSSIGWSSPSYCVHGDWRRGAKKRDLKKNWYRRRYYSKKLSYMCAWMKTECLWCDVGSAPCLSWRIKDSAISTHIAQSEIISLLLYALCHTSCNIFSTRSHSSGSDNVRYTLFSFFSCRSASLTSSLSHQRLSLEKKRSNIESWIDFKWTTNCCLLNRDFDFFCVSRPLRSLVKLKQQHHHHLVVRWRGEDDGREICARGGDMKSTSDNLIFSTESDVLCVCVWVVIMFY